MCNLAILTHRCRHIDLFKINCPANDDTTTCPPPRQTILGRYRSSLLCTACVTF